MHELHIGPHFERPAFPVLSPEHEVNVPDTDAVKRGFRKIYDWKAYSPEGLAIMEAYWDEFVAAALSPLLPIQMRERREQIRGINLGTFNGTYQKAWVRNGYSMYGVEIADVIDELHEYGLEGHRASFFDLTSIDPETFDFGVLDRAICTKGFYESYDRSHEATGVTRQETVPVLFESLFRIIREGGALVGVLYNWYTISVVDQLARYGELKIWPTYTGLLGFRVIKGQTGTNLPSIYEADPTESRCFRRFYPGAGGLAALHLPTNEIITLRDGQKTTAFAPTSPDWSVLSK
ncbi:MAG: hypothetical protein ACYC91_02660 [Solirubrobacteraceae bacterium]